MKIHLTITGGMGLTLTGSLDVADLPDELAEKAESLLTPERLTAATLAQSSPYAVGMREFEVTISSEHDGTCKEEQREENEVQHYRFVEADENIEIVDLLDELMREIVTYKQKMGKAQRE